MEWSLHKVVHYLSFKGVEVNTTLFLHIAVFLLVLALGYHSSQLVVMMRHPSYTFWYRDGVSLTVTPSSAFMAKNEQADSLPALLKEDQHHPLCPVRALKDNMQCTEGVSANHLFYNPRL